MILRNHDLAVSKQDVKSSPVVYFFDHEMIILTALSEN